MRGLRSNGASLCCAKKNAAAKSYQSYLLGEDEAGRYAFMHTVYILRSVNDPERLYVGLTTDVEKRLKEHNTDSSTYSKRYSPWELEVSISIRNKKTAENLEKYLKSGSGFAFLKKRLLPAKQNGSF